jgi:mannose/cellobiose epimerase-like protein (N-acyl-D-glucosamine 2-epimerase family)
MNRRTFINSALATSATAAGIGGMTAHPGEAATAALPGAVKGAIAGKTLAELREDYRYWLFTDFLPFMDRYVIDHELGGFMCTVDRDGIQLSSDKYSWYQGRGAWVYAFLYNKLDSNPQHLDAARKAVEFLEKAKRSGEGFMPNNFLKDGTPAPNSRPDMDGDIYMALAFQEYGKIPGNERYWDRAKEIFLIIMEWYDNPDFTCGYSYTVPDGKPPEIRGPRVIGYWMEFINIATQMLEFRKDPQIEAVADRSLDAIMNSHYNPDFGLINEVINHDLSRNKDMEQSVYTGHAIETLWMVMYEAVRRKDMNLFRAAAERFRRHVEAAWDDVYGGAFRALYRVDENVWALDKVTWLQEEILIGTMCMMAYTGSPWAQEWFGKTYSYSMEKLALKRYGFPLWDTSGNRKATFVRHGSRCENYHHPRHLMLTLHLLDALVKRNGKVLNMAEG